VVVAGLLVAADRVAAWAAGQVLAQSLVSAYQLDQRPDVQVQGVPFLTQWSSGRYQEVDVRTPHVTAQNVTVSDVSAQLHDVSTAPFATSPSAVAGATVGEVDAQGVVPYRVLPLPPGLQLTPQGDRLQLSGSYSVGPVTVPVAATVGVTVRNGSLKLVPEQVSVPSQYSRFGIASRIEQLIGSVSVTPPLPMGGRLQGASVTPAGLRVSATASQVALPR
jgi:hypothetical protein